MSQHQAKQNPVVLNYKKRMFDGGPEVEMIRYIEAKQALQALQQTQSEPVAETTSIAPQSINVTPQVAPVQAVNHKKRAFEAAIVGPFEIAVGLVGILTSGLAFVGFLWAKNEQIAEQSKAVLKMSLKTVGQGFAHTALAPVNVVRALTGH